MRTRKLGPLTVSVVGLGCNNFGGRLDEAATRAVVDAALEAGATFLDTADIYGNHGGSEELLGRVLQGRRDEVVLATKFGKEMGDGAERRGSRDYIRAALDASLRRLQTDVVDLYQHHEEDTETLPCRNPRARQGARLRRVRLRAERVLVVAPRCRSRRAARL